MDNPQIHNLKEEIRETVTQAITIPNHKCAVFRAGREDKFSPQGKAQLLESDRYESYIFDCTLCKACEQDSKLCTAFQKARTVLTLQKKDPQANKELLQNLKTTGNIYGIRN